MFLSKNKSHFQREIGKSLLIECWKDVPHVISKSNSDDMLRLFMELSWCTYYFYHLFVVRFGHCCCCVNGGYVLCSILISVADATSGYFGVLCVCVCVFQPSLSVIISLSLPLFFSLKIDAYPWTLWASFPLQFLLIFRNKFESVHMILLWFDFFDIDKQLQQGVGRERDRYARRTV